MALEVFFTPLPTAVPTVADLMLLNDDLVIDLFCAEVIDVLVVGRVLVVLRAAFL